MSNTKRRERPSPDYKNLPRQARIRDHGVAAILGMSVATVWRKAADPKSKFPKPRRDGGVTTWQLGETLDYAEGGEA